MGTDELDPIEAFLEAWRVNQRVNLRLIEAIPDEGMRCTLSTRGGRTVGRQWVHLHWVRLYHLGKRAKALTRGALELDPQLEPAREPLVAALEDSAHRVEQWLRLVAAGEARGSKRGLPTTLAYLVAHESHHRGNILLTLKQCGHKVDSGVQYAIWDWDRV